MANNKDLNKNKKIKKAPSKKTTSSKGNTTNGKKSTSTAVKKATPLAAPKNTEKKVVSKKKKIVKRVLFTMLFLGLAVFVVGLGYIFAIISSTPPLDVDAVTNLSQASSLYDKDGKFMDNLHTDLDRNIVEGSAIPENLKNAFVSIEDERFYKHSGIDVRRIAGSIVTDVVKIFSGKKGLHGGSTLTQQLLKNTILTNEDFIVERKIKEIYLALNLEKKLSKDEILTQYLNTIPLGGTTYGVDAASNLYFGKSVSELNLIQCAYIAGVTQAPTTYSAYNPNNKNDPSVYVNRTKTVLGKMKELGYISEEEYTKAISDIENGGLVFTPRKISYTLDYEWYINPTVSQVKKDLKEKYKYSDEEVSKMLANGGLRIHTNMDRELQDYAQQVINEVSPTKVGKTETYMKGTNTPEFQGAATVVDYRTGKVLALIGGRGEQSANSLNRAYTDLKPIGSSTKPLTVFGPAIEEKVVTAGSSIDDAPLPPTINYGADLQNVDKIFEGNLSVRDILAKSGNIGSVIVENSLGVKTGMSYGKKFGLVYGTGSDTLPALALGQFHNAEPDGGNTYLLASAFGVFGNNGNYTEPELYSKVTDASGKVLLETESKTKKIFSPQTSYIIYDIMKSSVSHSGPSAKFGNMPISGKTGTTSDAKDFWFTGITPHLSGSVWLGYDNRTVMKGYSDTAAAAWNKIMKKASEGMSTEDISMPDGLVRVSVCKDSGNLPTDLCKNDPRGNRVYEEYFIAGTEPTGYCENHVSVKINSSNNKLATDSTPKNLIVEKILVKKPYVNTNTTDYPYVLPIETDDTVASATPPPSDNGSDEGDDDKKGDDPKDDNKDPDKDKDKDNEKPITQRNSLLSSIQIPEGYMLNPMIRLSRLIKSI